MKIILYTLSCCTLFALFSCQKEEQPSPAVSPQKGIYKNGILSTGPVSKSGVLAPSGTTWSELQHTEGTSVTNATMGFASHYYGNVDDYRIADDFTVPQNHTWELSKVSVYAMAPATMNNPFDGLHIRIWKGDPSQLTSTVVYGNLNISVLSGVIDSAMYAIENSAVPASVLTPKTTTKIYKLSSIVNTTLPAGTYWLEWQVHYGPLFSILSPTIKVKGSRGLPAWNGSVFTKDKIWQKAVDTGNPTAAPSVQQDFAFEVEYSY